LGLDIFTLGEIELRQFAGDQARLAKPNEVAFDGSYSLKLSENALFQWPFSGRYISSNLKLPDNGSEDSKAASSFRSGCFWVLSVKGNSFIIAFDGRWRAGFNVFKPWK